MSGTEKADVNGIGVGILGATGKFVEELFNAHSGHPLPFHNYRHTVGVVKSAQEIGNGVGLSDDDREIVEIAAWFHDVGYFQVYQGHEEKGAQQAGEFLRERNYPEEKIAKVISCIMATRYPQRPTNLREQVLCDADMAHLAGEDADELGELLRKERKECCGEERSDLEWVEGNLTFLRNQTYHTEYARRTYGPKLAERIRQGELELQRLRSRSEANGEGAKEIAGAEGANGQIVLTHPKKGAKEGKGEKKEDEEKEKKSKKLKKLRKDLEKIQEELKEAMGEEGERPVREKEKKKEANIGGARLDRGIETMFRVTSGNHMRLSGMADSKAHIMISVNSIIISIVVSFLLRKLDDNPEYAVPALILLAVCLTTIIFAVLATRPKVTSGTFTQEDINDKKVNLLFFGNFHGVSPDEYHRGVLSMMGDSEYLYGSMIKDIYYLGQVLGRKYKYLRLSYNIFMYGLIVAVLAFLVAVIFAPAPSAAIFQQ